MSDSKPYLVKETLTFSDGTETVLNFKQNENAEVIEKFAEVETALHRGETPLDEFIEPEPLPEEESEVGEPEEKVL